MAAGESHLIAGVAEDAEANLTLGMLAQRVNEIISSGVPYDTPVKSGYLPTHLRDALYVEEPLEIKTMSISELRRETELPGSIGSARAAAAWDEIIRRLGEA